MVLKVKEGSREVSKEETEPLPATGWRCDFVQEYFFWPLTSTDVGCGKVLSRPQGEIWGV